MYFQNIPQKNITEYSSWKQRLESHSNLQTQGRAYFLREQSDLLQTVKLSVIRTGFPSRVAYSWILNAFNHDVYIVLDEENGSCV